jgi:ribonuclease J
MRVRIHRGANQIGGSAIEVEAAGSRLLLDCGLPLDGDEEDERLLPAMAGLCEDEPSLLGIVLSHGHRDHWGLIPKVRADLPLFMGAATERILSAAAPFVPRSIAIKAAGHLEDRQPQSIGPFTITPYLVDHSAFDSYALLIEAGGKRLFYSGDLRAHGRKGALFARMLRHPPVQIDAMLMEGSSIGRLAADASFPTETEIEQTLVDRIREATGMVLVSASAQNIDRVVSIYRAAKRTGRTLVVDLYAAEILRATGHASIPQTHWADVALFTPQRQRVMVKERALFAILDSHKAGRVFPEQLAAGPGRFVMLYRHAFFRDLVRAQCLEGATGIWSQWAGYLALPYGSTAWSALKGQGVGMETIHTSGHACIADLQRLAEAIAPKQLVPIHSFEPKRFNEFFRGVSQRHDGEWWEV